VQGEYEHGVCGEGLTGEECLADLCFSDDGEVDENPRWAHLSSL
jgi:hypothetical protein